MTLMNIPENDLELAANYGFRFYVAQREGPGETWHQISTDISFLTAAMEMARQTNAGEVGVFTTHGTFYWSSKDPEVFNSTILERGIPITVTLDHFQVFWSGYLKAKRLEKAKEAMNRIEKALGHKITVDKCERYWKDSSLFWVTFSCELDTNEISNAIFQVLQLNGKIADRWSVSRPDQVDENRWLFSGAASNSNKIAAIELIEFRLQNYKNEYSK